MIQHLDLENSVRMPGFVSYQQIGDWYGLAEAFVHPALQEQWGLVLNEACAAGLPILSSKTAGARYDLVREDHNGWLFDPLSKQEITSVLIKMHTSDRSKRTLMGKNSETIVAEFCPQRFARSLFGAIEAARGSRKLRRSKVVAGEESGYAQ
jgi:glycosyltransferase involved in cell wall biosynthesis